MKNAIRKKLLAQRRGMTGEEVLEKSPAAAEFFLNSDLYKNAEQIMLYKPLGNETDTSLIIQRAFDDGKQLVFPVTERETGAITPCLVNKETEFVKGGFSVFEPKSLIPADMTKTHVIIVPGVAFDEKGARIGFGKGCYDMFLKGLDIPKVGFCYGFQLLPEIPSEPHDVKMDYIITEKGFYVASE